MIELARAQPGIAVTQESWDANPWLLNVENGTIDLRIGALLEHDPANMLTKLTRVVYERDRKDERWDRFLRDATGNDEAVMEFLQAAAGYILSGSTAEEILLIIYGPEASGKTTYLEALRAVMGEYGKTITSDLLIRRKYARDSAAPSPDLAALAGVRLATCSEMDEGRDLAPAMVKNLTGGDTITARHLNAGLFDYMPQFKILLALNHCPYIPADDGALWRRIRRVGFERTVPPEQRDNTLKPYLRDPLGGGPAVLAWAVEGCLRWQKEGLNVPTAVHESTSAYREESDPLAEFFAETIEFREGARVMSEDLQLAYASYAKEHGISERDGVPLKKIWERLKQNHCVAIRRHAGRSWEGCTLKTTRVDSPRDGVTPRDTNDRDSLREGDSREGTGNAVTVCHAVTLSAPAVELARGTVADSSMMVQPEPSCCRPSVATTRTQAIVDDFGM
jgi:putative DNA primase/helicase